MRERERERENYYSILCSSFTIYYMYIGINKLFSSQIVFDIFCTRKYFKRKENISKLLDWLSPVSKL